MTDQGFDYTAARRALKERNQVAALEQVKTQTNDPYVKSEIDNRIEEATPLGFGEGWGRTMLGQERGAGDFAPFLSSANQFRQLKRLEAALDRASANRASEDDVNLIRQFYDEQTKPKTFGYDVGRIAAEALPFAGEFFLTRGAFGRLAKAGSAAKQASLLGRARTLMAGMAQPFQRYGRYAKEIATKRPVLGNTLLALGYEAPKQYIGQTVIGETLGGSRTRASAYTNYIANRYGIQAKGDYGVAVRVADDSYGMWTNALPAAVLDNYIELFSEAMGEALVHLPAAIKLTLMGDVGEAARRGAMKEVANNRLLSFLGLSPDPRYTKLWSDFGFQGLVPELGEEFVGAMTRDVVHQVAPQLAEGGNTQHLIENLPAVALGMGLGMFGPASVSSGLARMDYYVATADMDKETLEKVKALKKYAEAEGLQVMGRDLVQIAKIIDAGPTAAGSGALAADEFIRGKWMNSERVRNDALGRIGRRAEQNRERPDTSMEAVEEEMLAMLQEAMSLPFESQSQMGDRSPMLERLKELEIINAEEATDLERRFNARLAKLRKAFDEGKLADVAELAGDTEAKSMLAEMESRGINTSRQPIGFAAAAWQTRDALKQKLVEGVSRSPEGDIYINTQARDALAALTTREALSPQARRRVGEMDLVGVEEVQEQLAAREALVRELARSLPEYRFEADLRRPTPALARLQQQAGLAVVQFRGSKGAPVAQWDKENKVLFIDQSKIEAKAEELDMEVDELVGEVVLHEMIHVHVQRLGERGEEWLQELDEVLTQAGFPAESVSDKLNSGLYANLTDMARLEESVAFRVQPFGRMLATQPEQAEAQMPLYRRVFKWVFDELMMWLQPRSFYMKQFLKQRDMLENAGIDISDMSNSQVAIALSTAQHLGEVLQIAQRAEGAVFKSTRELEKMLGTVEEDIEVVPLAEFIPSVEETLAEDIPSNPALEDVVEQIPVTQEEFNFEQEVPQEDRTEPVAEQQLNAIQGAIETARRAELIPMLEEDLGVPLQREDGKQPRVAQLRRAMLVRLGLLELDGPKLKRLSEAVGADLSAPRAVEPVREEAPQEPAERPAEAVDEEAPPPVAEGLASLGLAAPEEAPQAVDEETPPPVAEGMAALGLAPAPAPAAEPAPEPAPEPEAEPAAEEFQPTLEQELLEAELQLSGTSGDTEEGYADRQKLKKEIAAIKRQMAAPEDPPVSDEDRKWQIKIISGGQTGADTVGLETAKALGIETGGYIGADYAREKEGELTGRQVAEDFRLTTTSTRGKEGYRERTIFNAQAADGTVLFGNPSSPGSLTTLGAVAQRNKPYPLVNPTAEQLANWMIVNDIHVLNVAGNRRSTIEGDAESQMAAWRETLTEALAIVERHGYDATNKAKWFGLNREVETSDQVRAELLREDVNDNLSEVGVKVAGSYDADTEYRYQIDQIDPDTGRRFVGAVQVLPSPALPRYMLHRARLEMEVKKRTVKGKTFEVAAVVPGQTVLTTQRLRETDDPGLRAVTIISDELDGTLRVRPVGQKVGSFRISKAQLYDPGTALRLDGQVPLFDAYGNKVPGTEPEGYVPYEEGEADSTGYLRWVRVSDGVVAARIDLDARGVGLSLLDDVERLGRAASASTAVDAGLAPLGVKPQLDIKPKEPGDQDEEKTPPPKRPKLIDPIKQEARAKFWQAIGDMIGVDPALADELISIRFPKDAEGKVTPKVVWNAEKANTLLREREKAEDAEEGQTLREAALGEAAESGAVVEYMLQPIEDVIGQVFNTGEIAVIDSRMEELGEDSIEFELLKMLRDSFRQVGLLGSEETVRGTVAAPRTAAEPEAVEPDDSDDEAQTIEMRQLPQYAAAPSEQVMGAISKKDLNAVVGRYLVNVLAASGTIAQNAERQRNMLNSGQLELWPGSPIMRRQSPWWQRFFVLTGGRDSALLSVLSTAAVYTPRPADEMDMPRSRTITNNEALRSSALVRAISLVGSVGSGIVAQGNIQQLPLAAMSSATAESLLSQLFKSSASHAFDDVDLERVRHMLSGDWSALVRTYQGQKGYKALSAWLEQYRDTMLRVAAKETNEKTAGTPEATKERMAAIKKLRSLPIIREAKSQAAMDLYEAIVGVDLAITQAQFAGTGVNDALRIQDDARAGAGLTTALAGITTNVAESLIATINDEVTQLIDVREALKEGKVGLADRLLRRLHEQAPLLRMATGSQVQLTMTSALPESLYKAARGLALRGADQPRQAFDSARVEIGGVTMLYAINPMVVHHNGSPAKAGTLANDFALMRALLLEERNHRTQVMHDAVMQELEGTTSMAEVRSAVNRVMDLAVKGGSVSKEYADNMANALVGRLVDEMQRPANVRNLSVAVFAALQKRGHVDIKANRQRTRISFVSELDSNRRLDVTVRPQEVQIADNIRMQRIYVYRLDTSGIPAEDVETKRKLVAYAVKHIRDVHKISNAQPETEHKDAYAIELSPELMAEEAIYKDLIRKDSEAFMDLGFGQVIDPTSIKGNFKAMPKNKAELRRFMSDPFYDDMEGMRSGLPYNGRGTSGFEIPEMWDLDRMPKGADDDWSSTAFLLAYDEWLRQLNRESYDANLSMAEFHNAIEKFVDDEGITGLQKWQRFDEINQAMLAAIDVYSWLTDGGWNYAKKLGYATNTTPRPTTFDGWIAFIEERKADQDRRLADGQKLREGEERLVGLGSDTRKILDIARKIHRGQGKWRALGFEEARLARVVVLPGREGAGYGEGFEGGLAAAMISKAAETTRRAWQGQLIRSKQDVYISLLWKDEEDRPMFEDANYGVQEPTAAGGPAKTGVGYRAKRRTILGYVHGSMMGRKLVRTGAVESWHRTTRNVNEALMNNAYIESLKAIGAIVKAPKTGVPGGYKRLEVKSIAGLQGYMAKEWIAKYLKNSLTQYGVKDIENPIYRNYMRLTIAAKHIMLMFGFFHHQAFLRSYLFTVRRSDAMPGGAKQMFRELGQIGLASGLSYLRAFGLVSQERLETVAQKFTPYRTGSQYIADRHVDLELGQQEGLTIQKGNEVVGGGMSGAAYDPDDKEAADQWVRKAFDRIAGWSMSEDRKQRAYQFVENFRRVQFETAAWLFNSMGANLKAAAYMSYFDELRMQNFERLKLDTDGSFLRSLARKAAMKTNADFGGLNLKAREGKASDIFGDGGPRDPKVQMALRALILAPDWTESNLVTVLNTVKTGNILGEPAEMERIEKNMYRHMWLRVGSRALAIQFIINMLLAGIDPDRDLYDLYEEAGFFGKVDDNTPKWSKFRWLDVNASLFSPTESRKFVSVFGHFGDPLKWTADFFNDSPIAPLDRKGSVAARMVVETITGADYSGRRFTTWREIMGIDYDAGVYQRKTTLKDGTVMMPGDSKAGKYAGKLSRFSTKTGAVSLEQVLGGGYLWTQLFKFMPLQGRAAIEFVTGQKDAFDFMMELTGTKYGRTYPK